MSDDDRARRWNRRCPSPRPRPRLETLGRRVADRRVLPAPSGRSAAGEGRRGRGRGQPILEHHRDPRTIVVAGVIGRTAPPSRAIAGPARRVTRSREGEVQPGGELLFRSGNRWRIAGGDRPDTLEVPFAGIVQAVEPGTGVTIRSLSSAITGRFVLAGPTWGRLQVATGPRRRAPRAARRRGRGGRSSSPGRGWTPRR